MEVQQAPVQTLYYLLRSILRVVVALVAVVMVIADPRSRSSDRVESRSSDRVESRSSDRDPKAFSPVSH